MKKIAIAACLFFSPYVAGNLFVFIFLVPVLSLLFSEKGPNKVHLLVIFAVLSGIVLAPLISYDTGTYVLSVLMVSLFISLFLYINAVVIKTMSDKWFSVFVPCVVWMGLMRALDHNSLMTAAFNVGILFPESVPLIRFAGSTGLTALLILFNSAVARSIAKRDTRSILAAAILVCVFAASYLCSLSSSAWPSAAGDTGMPVRIALIQGDAPGGGLSGYTERLDKSIERYAALSLQAAREDVDIVVWPEYALPVDVLNRFPRMMEPVTRAIKDTKADFIIGSVVTAPGGRGNYNAALLFDKDANVKDSYYSRKPIMFSKNIVAGENGGKLFLGKAGVALCWEEVDPGIFRDYSLAGAEYFIVLSSNAGLDRSWLKRYASFFSRARAAENGRYLARATRSGVTQIAGPSGRVISSIPSSGAAFLAGDVRGLRGKTFYAVHGDIFADLFLIVCSMIILAGMLPEIFRASIGVPGGYYPCDGCCNLADVPGPQHDAGGHHGS